MMNTAPHHDSRRRQRRDLAAPQCHGAAPHGVPGVGQCGAGSGPEDYRVAQTTTSAGRRARGSAGTHLLTLIAGIALGVLLALSLAPMLRAPASSGAAPPGTGAAGAPVASQPALAGLSRQGPVVELAISLRDGHARRTQGLLLLAAGAGQPPAPHGGVDAPAAITGGAAGSTGSPAATAGNSAATIGGPAGGLTGRSTGSVTDAYSAIAVAVALEDLHDAVAVRVAGPDGGGTALRSVVGVDPLTGFALLSTMPGTIGALRWTLGDTPLDDPAASLYAGRDVTIAGPGGQRRPARIESTGRTDPYGAFVYPVAGAGVAAARGIAAVLAPGTGRALGVAGRLRSPPHHGPREQPLVALELRTLGRLASSSKTQTDYTIAAFSSSFFEQEPAGRLVAARAAIRAGDDRRVIALLAPIVNLGSPWSELAGPALGEAYRGRLDELLDADRLVDSENLLAEVPTGVWPEWEMQILNAEIRSRRGDPRGAIEGLHRAWHRATSDAREELRLAARRTLTSALVTDSLTPASAIALLEAQTAIDAEHAPAHAALGRLLYEAGRYGESLPALYRARGLDPARYSAGLTPLIELAEARAYTPGTTVVPVYSDGASRYVEARIPGRPGRLRLLLDTGASLTAVTPAVLDGLVGARARGSVRLQTANGIVDAPRITLPGLDVGGATVRNLDVVVLDSLSGYDGLLGLSYLDNFDMELDGGGGRMILRTR